MQEGSISLGSCLCYSKYNSFLFLIMGTVISTARRPGDEEEADNSPLIANVERVMHATQHTSASSVWAANAGIIRAAQSLFANHSRLRAMPHTARYKRTHNELNVHTASKTIQHRACETASHDRDERKRRQGESVCACATAAPLRTQHSKPKNRNRSDTTIHQSK